MWSHNLAGHGAAELGHTGRDLHYLVVTVHLGIAGKGGAAWQSAMVAVQELVYRTHPLLKRTIRWLLRLDVPPNMQDEGLNLLADAMGVLGAMQQNDLAP